jgi:DivIVA domain-containing protein
VERDSIDRIRSATFPLGRRGYEKREVDRFLNQLADWLETGGGDQARTELVRRDLEEIGRKTGAILTAAHDAGEELRSEATEEATQTIADGQAEAKRIRAAADSYSKETRSAADQYARKVRSESDEYSRESREEADDYSAETRAEAERDAAQIVASAQADAKRIVDDANRRRRDIETVIADLDQRRDAAVGELERLSSALIGAATQHRGEGTATETKAEVANS